MSSFKKFLVLSLFIALMTGCNHRENEASLPPSITTFDASTETLQGPSDEIRLINAFPFHLYDIHNVAGQGSFYLDRDGRDYIKDLLKRGVHWESYLVDTMIRHVRHGTTVLDIGAHIGTHTTLLSKLVGESGKVIAFEPQMKIYTELTQNLKLNKRQNVLAMRCALGEQQAKVEMCPSTTENEGGTPIGNGGDPVQMMRLDDLHLSGVSFIKIDVENSEYQVLLGAKETLMRNRPAILIEIMGNYESELDDREGLAEKTLELLKSYGYSVNHLSGWDWLATPL